ncbi:MAG: hypothetical protein QM699_02230 [Amaricoccus sp.]|uniref:hypothetical protein n=1 Tax=Amaricoccus sp. TaxID=1872485 RepID=UPI0039E6AEFA
MSKLILLVRAMTALGLLAMTPEARAEEPGKACAAHADVVRKLSDRFGETRTSIGLHKDDAVVEVFSSAATGTWTIVVTGTDGMSCLLAAGKGWEQAPAGMPASSDQGA